MVEDLKSLIEKINQEGVKAAEDKAKDIETSARKKAEEIVAIARREAEKIIADAKSEVARMEKSGEASLKQAGRNLLISLRKEIDSILGRLVTLRVRDELTPGVISDIISSLVKNYKGGEEDDVIISLSKGDLERLKKGFLAKLKEETKKGIVLKHAQDIQAGFIISYDSGRSHFDFTDKGLADHISAYLRPHLAELLGDVTSSENKEEK